MLTDYYDSSFDEIRDFIDSELTNEQIVRVLDEYEDEYNSLEREYSKDEDGFDTETIDSGELSDLNEKIVAALENEVDNG